MTTLVDMARAFGGSTGGGDLPSVLAEGLSRVSERFQSHLDTKVTPVAALCRHVERYRGKMLRPTLTLLSGLACDPRGCVPEAVTESLVTVGAVVEMVHVATLVHDDVLDEADSRRSAPTINALKGNEAAVMLGDYLIARSFHLCSTLDQQRTALRIGEVTSTVCEGELLQLVHRGDLALDEPLYFDIVERKTASLIAAACELGAFHAGADSSVQKALSEYGRLVGVAFQIQDDLLDLIGEDRLVGKSLGKDLEKQKLTLPVIHHLASLPHSGRLETERLIQTRAFDNGHRHEVTPRLNATGSIAYARQTATRLIEQAKASLEALPASPAKNLLITMADAVIRRDF